MDGGIGGWEWGRRAGLGWEGDSGVGRWEWGMRVGFRDICTGTVLQPDTETVEVVRRMVNITIRNSLSGTISLKGVHNGIINLKANLVVRYKKGSDFLWGGRKEKKEMGFFNDAHNTFYLLLYGVRHMAKDHSDSERRNPLPPHGLLFPISSKCYFICIIQQTE